MKINKFNKKNVGKNFIDISAMTIEEKMTSTIKLKLDETNYRTTSIIS
ncbi:hypothetical protein EMIT036CA2_70058 [Chryseobacterium sp. IT-36CA2]